MFKFKVLNQSKNSLFRTGIIQTAHGEIHTPAFMPCATVGAVKGVSPQELSELGFEMILTNTYHLYLRPGQKTIKKMGGLQKWMNWNKPILTDSGGFQVFSLGRAGVGLAKVGESGVWFQSHLDGSKHQFTPEKVIDIQKDLGSDIMMVLDECTEYPATCERAEKSLERTHRWAKRGLEHWQKVKGDSPQALFGIIQGSIYPELRKKSAEYISSLGFDGIAIGGVSVGEGKTNMYKVMRWLGPILPHNKPHYLMGVGEPEDILEALKWGFDLFDCVLPTRLARHGTVWTTINWRKFAKIDLSKAEFKNDQKVIMKNCLCPTCGQGFSRAYLSHLIRQKEMLGMRLLTLHNLFIVKKLLYTKNSELI